MLPNVRPVVELTLTATVESCLLDDDLRMADVGFIFDVRSSVIGATPNASVEKLQLAHVSFLESKRAWVLCRTLACKKLVHVLHTRVSSKSH